MARKPSDQSVNREDIIRAAADVLHRNGYETTTMKDIAAEVNLTAASLYHHFRNKDMLLLAVLEAGLELVIEQLEPIVGSDQSTAEKLKDMIIVHVTNVTRHPSVGAAMVFEIRPLMIFKVASDNGTQVNAPFTCQFNNRRDTFFEQRNYFEGLFREVIQEGIERGEFRPVDAGIYTKMMLGAHNWVAVWYREGGRLDGETIAIIMAENFLNGLKLATHVTQ